MFQNGQMTDFGKILDQLMLGIKLGTNGIWKCKKGVNPGEVAYHIQAWECGEIREDAGRELWGWRERMKAEGAREVFCRELTISVCSLSLFLKWYINMITTRYMKWPFSTFLSVTECTIDPCQLVILLKPVWHKSDLISSFTLVISPIQWHQGHHDLNCTCLFKVVSYKSFFSFLCTHKEISPCDYAVTLFFDYVTQFK